MVEGEGVLGVEMVVSKCVSKKKRKKKPQNGKKEESMKFLSSDLLYAGFLIFFVYLFCILSS